MQNVYIGLRRDWTSAWNRNPLDDETEKLHQGQENPGAENICRLKERIATYGCPALILALLEALLGTEPWTRWSRVWTSLASFTSLLVTLKSSGWNTVSSSWGLKSHWQCSYGNCFVFWKVLALHNTRKRLSGHPSWTPHNVCIYPAGWPGV